MSVEKRVENIKNEFSDLDDWEEKYRYIIKRGQNLNNLDEAFRLDKYKVKGCQSQVWLVPDNADGKIHFQVDSDAAIVKGLISILMDIYNDLTPDEILNTKPDFVDDLGLRQHLSMSRANGLNAMLKQISLYATVFKQLEKTS